MKSIDSLIKLFQSESASERLTATHALTKLGEKASPAIPYLIKALADPHISDAAMWVLGAIGEAAIEPLAKTAEGKDPTLSRMAVLALGRYPHFAAKRVEALSLRLNDTRPEIKEMAIVSLKELQQRINQNLGLIKYPLSDADKNVVSQIEDLLANNP